jgi:hypothetical protein
MHMAELKARTADALVKVFRCEACNREMRLMVWNRDAAPVEEDRT